jgi:DNA (cytosine-5)-methyltransferase 1
VLLPTPTASNPNDGESLESWEARRQRNLAKGINGNGQGTPLAIAVKLLPTPMAGDAKGTRNATAGRKTDNPKVNVGWTLSDVVYDGQLLPTPTSSDGERTSSTYGRGNPTLTGALTDPPSAGGKPSSAGPPPGPPTLWDD